MASEADVMSLHRPGAGVADVGSLSGLSLRCWRRGGWGTAGGGVGRVPSCSADPRLSEGTARVSVVKRLKA